MSEQNYSGDSHQIGGEMPPSYTQYYNPGKKSKTWLWVLIGCAAFVALIVVLVVFGSDDDNAYQYRGEPHIARIFVEGTISSTYSGGYNHEFLLTTIDELIMDSNNVALIIYVDSPGGELLAGSELSDKVTEYRRQTGREVYVYGHNTMASGGYWLACAADKIYANRYCITGSIGVAYGSMFDVSGLLEKLGIKVNTITSGQQKGMGSYFEEMTPETRAIYETLLQEYYNDFVTWVSLSRSIDKDTVITLADGRIYSARQALDLKLIDAVGTYDDALADLDRALGATYPVQDYLPTYIPTIWDTLLSMQAEGADVQTLLNMLPPAGPISYYEGY